jgi:serine/threonine-protein kinase
MLLDRMSVSGTTSGATPEDSAVRGTLERVLASKAFQSVERLKRFLRFIVEQTLAGHGAKLKEFLIGIEVFEKPDSFDPRNDPIVRVQARRLREKLAQYYESEGREDALWIDLPKGSYVPAFHRPPRGPRQRAVYAQLPSQNTIAVLPFADLSPRSDHGHFCDGLRDEIIHGLLQSGSLRTIPWTRPLERGGRLGPVLDTAEELDIATLIDGSVRQSANDIRVTVQRIDAVRGEYVWSETFDAKGGDVFALQEEIAHAVADELRGHPSSDLAPRLTRQSTEAVEAYDLYLKGRHGVNQRSEASLRRAVEFFEQAVQEDPKFALAYSGLADALALLANYGYVSPGETWSRAAAAATSAVLLDQGSAEAHTSLAHVNATHHWDWHAAEAEFQRAIQLNSHYAPARHWFGIACLAPQGRLDEAIEQMEIGLRLDPVSQITRRDLAVLHYFRRDYQTARLTAQQTIDQEPFFYGAYWIMGLVYEQESNFGSALGSFQKALELVPGNPRMMSALGRCLALAGQVEESRKVLADLDRLAARRYVSPLDPALIQLALEDHDHAFERLNRLLEYRCFDLIHLPVDPRFDDQRRNPRFTDLIHKLGLTAIGEKVIR